VYLNLFQSFNDAIAILIGTHNLKAVQYKISNRLCSELAFKYMVLTFPSFVDFVSLFS
jgi:hypothetical protein